MTTLNNLSPWDVEVIKCDGSSCIVRANRSFAHVKANGKVWLDSSPNKGVKKIKVVGLPENRTADWTLVPKAVAQCSKDKNRLLIVEPPLLGQNSRVKLPS
jgi:hypothetical protein